MMGYFPNGESNEMYADEYCRKCIHGQGDDGQYGCPIMKIHWLHNYDECNNKDSILHDLIPMDAKGYNEKCGMMVDANGEYVKFEDVASMQEDYVKLKEENVKLLRVAVAAGGGDDVKNKCICESCNAKCIDAGFDGTKEQCELQDCWNPAEGET